MTGFVDAILERFRPTQPPRNALVLSGGGARAAYQAGVLRFISDAFPEADFPVLTGVSAGSINTAHIANDLGSFPASVGHLIHCWESLTADQVFEAPSSFQFFWTMIRGGGRSENTEEIVPRYGLVDTAPLHRFLSDKLSAKDGRLSHIETNLQSGRLSAVAIITTNYATGQTVTWVQGNQLEGWERPNRVGIRAELSIEHVMASTSLPFLFPAVQLGDAWYGDGGIRLSEPLSPAIHLGADRILAISTRYARSRREADEPTITGYPPSAQIFGLLLNAVFLDRLDQDAAVMERFNRTLSSLPRSKWDGMKPIRLLLMRPSIDIGRLSGEYQADLSGILNLIAKGLGSSDTKSPDWLSMLLFDPSYTQRLIEIGYNDGRNQRDALERFLAD